jgi:hypothetical protein
MVRSVRSQGTRPVQEVLGTAQSTLEENWKKYCETYDGRVSCAVINNKRKLEITACLEGNSLEEKYSKIYSWKKKYHIEEGKLVFKGSKKQVVSCEDALEILRDLHDQHNGETNRALWERAKCVYGASITLGIYYLVSIIYNRYTT